MELIILPGNYSHKIKHFTLNVMFNHDCNVKYDDAAIHLTYENGKAFRCRSLTTPIQTEP